MTRGRGYEIERDVRMEPGDTVAVGGYTFRFDGVASVPGPNYRAARGAVTVLRDGRPVELLRPEKRIYNVQPHARVVELAKTPWVVPECYGSVIPMLAGETLPWQVVAA